MQPADADVPERVTEHRATRSASAVRPVVLIDTYSLFFRAFHALPAMQTSLGEPTSALYGFSVLLLKVFREHRPAGVAFAVDAPQKTFRHKKFAEYKAQRDPVPSPLVAQLRRLDQLLQAMAVPVFRAPGFEADDVLATLARGFSAERVPAIVVSGDRDLFQVIDENVRVLFVGARGTQPTMYDLAAVEQRFQVLPRQLPSWTALVGDVSDNLPGVPGVGPRTASNLVRRFDDISGLLDHLAEVTPVKIHESLAAHGRQALLNEELAGLRSDVPLGEGPRATALQPPAFIRLRDLFTELEFKSLQPRLAALAASIQGSELAT